MLITHWLLTTLLAPLLVIWDGQVARHDGSLVLRMSHAIERLRGHHRLHVFPLTPLTEVTEEKEPKFELDRILPPPQPVCVWSDKPVLTLDWIRTIESDHKTLDWIEVIESDHGDGMSPPYKPVFGAAVFASLAAAILLAALRSSVEDENASTTTSLVVIAPAPAVDPVYIFVPIFVPVPIWTPPVFVPCPYPSAPIIVVDSSIVDVSDNVDDSDSSSVLNGSDTSSVVHDSDRSSVPVVNASDSSLVVDASDSSLVVNESDSSSVVDDLDRSSVPVVTASDSPLFVDSSNISSILDGSYSDESESSLAVNASDSSPVPVITATVAAVRPKSCPPRVERFHASPASPPVEYSVACSTPNVSCSTRVFASPALPPVEEPTAYSTPTVSCSTRVFAGRYEDNPSLLDELKLAWAQMQAQFVIFEIVLQGRASLVIANRDRQAEGLAMGVVIESIGPGERSDSTRLRKLVSAMQGGRPAVGPAICKRINEVPGEVRGCTTIDSLLRAEDLAADWEGWFQKKLNDPVVVAARSS